jgi:zinc/manganese transport system substrate-binding protein
VVVLPQLVMCLAVAQIDSVNEALSLHARYCAEDTGVVGAAPGSPDRVVELIDRPDVAARGREQEPDSIANGTWRSHPLNVPACALTLRNVVVQYSCVMFWRGWMGRYLTLALVVLALTVGSSACGELASTGTPGLINVVAGENFWGSIAAQLGGSKASVHSVVTDPNADPHEYETSAGDARAFADAELVILNGAGYDDWGQKMLDANANSHRKVFNIAQLLGRKPGDNPHFWYEPTYVLTVADRITAEYKAIDPGDGSFFDQQRSAFTTAIKPYSDRLAEIKSKFAGTPIGSTESIFVYMASALRLNLISPPEFMDAIAEGTDPPASAVVTFHDQIANKKIKVLVYNVQASSAVTANLKQLAQQHQIPLVGVSETLQPIGATFQEWQVAQLTVLEAALASSP